MKHQARCTTFAPRSCKHAQAKLSQEAPAQHLHPKVKLPGVVSRWRTHISLVTTHQQETNQAEQQHISKEISPWERLNPKQMLNPGHTSHSLYSRKMIMQTPNKKDEAVPNHHSTTTPPNTPQEPPGWPRQTCPHTPTPP